MRVARGIAESKSIKVARFGDNMRQVAVTEGNKSISPDTIWMASQWIRGRRFSGSNTSGK